MTGHTAPLDLVLVPGLAGHAAEFAGVAERWDRGSVLALDDFVDGDLSIVGQADRLAAVLDRRGLERCLAAGHSHGGLVVLELAQRRPDLVAAVAVLDSPVLPPTALRVLLRGFAALVRTAAGPGLLRSFFRATFTSADSADFRAEVMTRLAAVPRQTAAEVVRGTFGYQGGAALAALTVPAAFVRANIPTPLDRLPAGITGVDISDAGHWVHVHRPHEVSRVLHDLATEVAERARHG